MLRIKIICTIGPASRETDLLEKIAAAGMNVARLNMSHGTHEYHSGTIERVRSVSEKLGKPIAIIADLQGPKLRVGKMKNGGLPLREGEEVILTTEPILGEPGRIPIQYEGLPEAVRPGDRILLDDGLLEMVITATDDHLIHAQIVIGGVLHDNKGLNLPDGSLNIPALTAKDRADVKFALDHQVDWIAVSFVRTASEVLELKAFIQEQSPFGRLTPVIAKIEKPEAVANIDSVITAADAIMVARGDLGIETSAEAVPMIQKMIISKCHSAACPVITATQMLDSMIRNPRPTRAEASDVANAVLDGSDAIMLSGETASGAYPVEAVRTMVRIAEEAERAMGSIAAHGHHQKPPIFTASGAICMAAMQTAEALNAKAIVAPTVSGATARLIAAFRPKVPVVAITPSPMVQRRLALYWGTFPLLTRRLSNTDEVVTDAIEVAQRAGYIGAGDTVVLTAGVVGSVRSATNLMMVRTVEHVLARGVGLGQREVAGRLRRLTLPADVDPQVGPQDILFCERVDRSCIKLLQRAGGLITREGGLDSAGAVAAVELGIPAIIGVEDEFDNLADGVDVIMNTTGGIIMKWKR